MTDTNKKYLISQIEGLAELDGRYKSLQCINFKPTEPRRGNFSLVFRAFDKVEDCEVAIKFFDPDLLADQYRLACFEREPEILAMLIGSRRCLQMDGPIRQYDLKIPLPDGTDFLAPILFFVSNWVDRDIDAYFEVQDKIESLAKLDVFRGIVLRFLSSHLTYSLRLVRQCRALSASAGPTNVPQPDPRQLIPSSRPLSEYGREPPTGYRLL